MEIDNIRNSLVRDEGFTLIELLIVIAVISVLAASLITLINPLAQFNKANDAKRKSDLSEIQKALEQYYNDHNQYPATTGTSTTPNYQITGAPWGGSWAVYMSLVPKDPVSGKNYVYVSNGTSYWLYTNLDFSKDPQICNNGAACTNAKNNGVADVSTACGGGKACNYGVTSSDTTP